jgi:hypothetical protein
MHSFMHQNMSRNIDISSHSREIVDYNFQLRMCVELNKLFFNVSVINKTGIKKRILRHILLEQDEQIEENGCPAVIYYVQR